MFQYGRFPKPISLIALDIPNGYRIADGHHRFLAWHTSGEIINALPLLPDEDRISFEATFREKRGIDVIAPFSPVQSVWVARKRTIQ